MPAGSEKKHKNLRQDTWSLW